MKHRKNLPLRWALALVALTVMAVGVAPTQASTGGASSFTATSEEETPEGGLAFGPLRTAGASWYGGPSMWGRSTACGQTLRPTTLGVAHKSLPCGTTVKFVYHGHAVITQVIDRGPYIKGRAWDLTQAASEALDFEGVGNVRYAIALNFARK
ncbi:MAG TPA: septal ring lytic transglycosylase RlpA family protein [Solirubrobacterales bacterium]|nr:septal ring lytic transglycosylase RlpA family protein [Solirubrobacterales bacterium]